MALHNIELTEGEWTEFLKAIDANSDGVLDPEEWENILVPKMQT